MFFLLFFFFKQKTAYEMRISDWSSDVCSSDLPASRSGPNVHGDSSPLSMAGGDGCGWPAGREHYIRPGFGLKHRQNAERACAINRLVPVLRAQLGKHLGNIPFDRFVAERSEEHTSELQSLMRISYAVFCLKKKKKDPMIHYRRTKHNH